LTGEIKDDLTLMRMEFDFQKVNERSNNLFLILLKKENFNKSEKVKKFFEIGG
jgi:hypothetical protein